MSAGTFATFSKFHLNTSKYPNVKVVYLVEGHNFHVEWHWRFGVQMGEKCRSTPQVTIHRRPENSQLGMRFVHNWLRKRPYTLCRSCRGIGDLQLWYSPLGPLQFKNLEKNPSKQGQMILNWTNRAHARDAVAARRPAVLRAQTEVSPPTVGLCVVPWVLWQGTIVVV
jgi:hypothetical protein